MITDTATNMPDYIPYELRVKILQIDPKLDVYWEEYLTQIFNELSAEERNNVNEQLLKDKGIVWDKETQSFEYKDKNDIIGGDLQSLISLTNHPQMQLFIGNLVKVLEQLESCNDVAQVADILENNIEQIKDFDVGRNLPLQAVKYKVLSAFVYQAATIIRNKKSAFIIPDNKRKLNAEICKTFINEIYLKEQLLGYSFKTLANRQLLDYSVPLIHDFLHQEQKVRKLHIVRTSKYIFAVAPSIEHTVSPYRTRRFLEENRLFSRDSWVLKGCCVDVDRLEKEKDPQLVQSMEEQFRHHIDHIVSVQSTVNPLLVELFDKLEDEHQDLLLPLLFKPLNAEKDISGAIIERLQTYEDLLGEYILIPLHEGLGRMLVNHDECEYAFIAAQQLFGTIINVFENFQSLPAVRENRFANRFADRLVAYAIFLKKRYSDIFMIESSRAAVNYMEEVDKKMRSGFEKLTEIISKNFAEYYSLEKEVQTLKEKLDGSNSFLDKLLKRKQHWETLRYEKQRQANKISWNVHQETAALPKEFKEQIVDLEFDALMVSNDNLHRYAFPAGENGLTKLPVLLTFSNNVSDFDFTELTRTVSPELMYQVTGGKN